MSFLAARCNPGTTGRILREPWHPRGALTHEIPSLFCQLLLAELTTSAFLLHVFSSQVIRWCFRTPTTCGRLVCQAAPSSNH
jgi:hypothetical protein